MGFIPNNQSSSSSSSTSNQLRTLNDCQIINPSNGQGLIYDGTINRWSNKDLQITGGGASKLEDLTDCNTSDVYNDQVLVYNNKWTPFVLSGDYFTVDNTNKIITTKYSLGSLTDVTNATEPSNDQILVFTTNGYKWKPYSFSGSLFNDTDKTIKTSISTLTDVSSALSPSNHQLLMFYTALNKWTPYNLSGATIDDTSKTITVNGGGNLPSLNSVIISTTPPTTGQVLPL